MIDMLHARHGVHGLLCVCGRSVVSHCRSRREKIAASGTYSRKCCFLTLKCCLSPSTSPIGGDGDGIMKPKDKAR
jgi:hypothetical protein